MKHPFLISTILFSGLLCSNLLAGGQIKKPLSDGSGTGYSGEPDKRSLEVKILSQRGEADSRQVRRIFNRNEELFVKGFLLQETEPTETLLNQDKPTSKKIHDFVKIKRSYPKNKLSGLLGLLLTPSLSQHELQEGKVYDLEVSSSFISENYEGQDSQYNISFKGFFLRQMVSLSLKAEGNWVYGLQLEAGIHNSDITILSVSGPPVSLLSPYDLAYSLGQVSLYGGRTYSFRNMDVRPYVQFKFNSGSRKNFMSSGDTDAIIGVQTDLTFLNSGMSAQFSYMILGNIAILSKSISPQNSFGVNIGAYRVTNLFSGTRVSASLNILENPFRNIFDMNDYSETVTTISFNTYNTLQHSDLGLDFSIGLSSSAPDYSLGLSVHF